MARRLLERLEQRVERRRREHVDLVDDVDLVRAAHRRKAHRVDDLLTHVVDARAARGVQLIHIGVGSRRDGLALGTRAVRHAARGALRTGGVGLLAQ